MAKTSIRAISARALALLMALEGFRAMPYRDIAGVWTDGYGNTHGVVPGRPVTEAQARATLIKHTENFGAQILKCLNREPTQAQYDAFVLAAINFGIGAPGKASGFCWQKSGSPSTIVRRFNAGDEPGACLALMQWVYANKKYVQGLFNRRWQEYQLCLEGTYAWNTTSGRHATQPERGTQ